MRDGEWKHLPAVPIKNVVDWEGCGDTITAVFINELGKLGLPKIYEISEEQIVSALKVAVDKAALCTQYYGAKEWLNK